MSDEVELLVNFLTVRSSSSGQSSGRAFSRCFANGVDPRSGSVDVVLKNVMRLIHRMRLVEMAPTTFHSHSITKSKGKQPSYQIKVPSLEDLTRVAVQQEKLIFFGSCREYLLQLHGVAVSADSYFSIMSPLNIVAPLMSLKPVGSAYTLHDSTGYGGFGGVGVS